MTRNRVFILIDSLHPYGAERVAIDLAAALQRTVDVTLLTYKSERLANAAFVPEGVSHIHLAVTGRGARRVLSTGWALWRLLRHTQPLVLISFMPYANAVAAVGGRLAGVPVIATEHNLMSIAEYAGRERPLLMLAIRIYVRLVCAVVAVSDAVRDDLVESFGAPSKKITTLYNPIDVDRVIRSACHGRGAVPSRESRDEVRLVMVGRLKEAKGHECALRALLELPTWFRLYVVGDGPLRSDLEDLTRSLGLDRRVTFVGWQPDAAAWIQSADIVWMPSLFEGFGLVLVESHVLQRPTIPSAAPGLREVAEHLGIDTVPPGDCVSLAEATARIAGQGGAEELHPWVRELEPARVAARYLSIAERCAGLA
jgi:glycosyltransferase involved in cell wall biosynthesis